MTSLNAYDESMLHPGKLCKNSEEDIIRMSKRLIIDPRLLTSVQNCLNKQGHYCDRFVSPLVDAVRLGHYKCAQFLIESGISITQTSCSCRHYDKNVLMNAIDSKDIKTVTCILNAGFDPICYDPAPHFNKNFYARWAANKNLPTILQLLIDFGTPVDDFHNFNINLSSYVLEPVSIRTIILYSPQCLKVCLFNGAAIDHCQIKNYNFTSEIIDCLSLIHHFAVFAFKKVESCKEILTILYELGANLWQKNRLGMTPLEVRTHSKYVWIKERNERGYYLNNHCYGSEDFKRISEYMKELMGRPRNLTSSCRLMLFRYLGKQYLTKIKLLPLPQSLIKFLEGSDFTIK